MAVHIFYMLSVGNSAFHKVGLGCSKVAQGSLFASPSETAGSIPDRGRFRWFLVDEGKTSSSSSEVR